MAITVRGARIDSLTIARNKESGSLDVQGSYSLVSTADKVLAKQSFNGYSDIKVTLSPESLSALDRFYASLARDVSALLGFDLEPTSIPAAPAAPSTTLNF